MKEEIVKKLYIDLSDASINKDINKLNEILSDEYILVHMTGMNQSKEDYINSVKAGELKYYESIHEEIIIEYINESEARIVGKTKTLASPFGMGKSWWRLKQTMTLKKLNGVWLITKSVASIY